LSDAALVARVVRRGRLVRNARGGCARRSQQRVLWRSAALDLLDAPRAGPLVGLSLLGDDVIGAALVAVVDPAFDALVAGAGVYRLAAVFAVACAHGCAIVPRCSAPLLALVGADEHVPEAKPVLDAGVR
jgi:hypothetical protein